MNVLIAGGGRTGARLANLLINQNYKVRLVENRRELLGYLHQELPTEVIYEGNPVDPSVLEAAGIREVHAVAAVTSNDSTNLVDLLSCQNHVRCAAHDRARQQPQ